MFRIAFLVMTLLANMQMYMPIPVAMPLSETEANPMQEPHCHQKNDITATVTADRQLSAFNEASLTDTHKTTADCCNSINSSDYCLNHCLMATANYLAAHSSAPAVIKTQELIPAVKRFYHSAPTQEIYRPPTA